MLLQWLLSLLEMLQVKLSILLKEVERSEE